MDNFVCVIRRVRLNTADGVGKMFLTKRLRNIFPLHSPNAGWMSVVLRGRGWRFSPPSFTIPPPCMGSAAVGKTVRGFAETGYDTEPGAAAKSGISPPLGALLVRLLRDGRFGYYNA